MQGVWAVHFFPEGLQADESAQYHAFLLVSMRTGTKVLRTGEDLDELSAQQADFVLDSRTVFAGNLLQASRIVQVDSFASHPLHIRLQQTGLPSSAVQELVYSVSCTVHVAPSLPELTLPCRYVNFKVCCMRDKAWPAGLM